MSKINISGVIDETMIKRFQGLASGKGKDSLAQTLAGKSNYAASLPESLRVGARTFSNAVKNVNTVINVINISEATLQKLGEMTEKLITLTSKATEGGVGPDARNQFDRQFKRIGRDFIKAVKAAEVSDNNILSREGLVSVFKAIGLDPENSESIAAVFAQFVTPDKDKSALLASEFSKSRKPVYIPPDAYGRGGGASGDATAAGTGLYQKSRTVVKGADAIHALARDLNNDTFQDLITTTAQGSLSVRMGGGDGSFGKATTYTQSGLLLGGSETVADLNADGKIDLAAAVEGQNKIALLTGNGDGTFKTATQITTTQQVKSVRALYADGDNRADVAGLRADGSAIEVFKSQSDGSWVSTGAVTLQGAAREFTATDIDHDGIADLVSLRNDGDIEIARGLGDGRFAATRVEQGLAGATSLHSADFDGDGVADLALTRGATGQVLVQFGEGGGFVDPVQIAPGREISATTVKDINRDGAADLVLSHAQSGTVSVVLSNGDGTFRAPLRSYTGPNPGAIVAEDFTTDFVDDIITVNRGDQTVGLLQGKQDIGLAGSGQFSLSSKATFGDGNGSTVGEFNRDGAIDLATAGYFVRTMNGSESGSFSAKNSLGTAVNSYSQIVSGDLNGDGNDDLVATEKYSAGVSVFMANGDGSFKAAARYDAFADAPNSGERLALADVNGDNSLDVVVTNPQGRQVGVLLGNTDGTLRSLQTLALNAPGPIRDITVADFNGDSVNDLVVSSGENEVELLVGQGSGTFVAGARTTMGISIRNIVSGDFDGDGLTDIAAADYRGNAVAVRLGNGDGSFTSERSFSTGQRPTGVKAADLNADGVLDLVTANADNSATVLTGDGFGGFEKSATISTQQGVARNTDVAIADVNNDGVSDLVINNAGDGPAIALGEATIREVGSRGSGALGGLSKYFDKLFDTERNIRSRADAYVMLADLKELRGQIDKNVVALGQAREVVGKNLELVRAAGLAFLDVSDQITGAEQASTVASKIQDMIRRNAAAALSQAENLEPLIVAALTVDDEEVN